MSPDAAVATPVAFEVSDISQQKIVKVSDVPPEATVGEVVQELLDELQLSQNDASGHSLSYRALLQRESRHLHATETVGQALQPGDRLTLQPDIDAG